ncbi:sensor histidine kinase [Clostridium sp. DL1XJH146]
MKNKSISFKIFMVFLMFTIGIFLLIGIFSKVFLPKYYLNKKMGSISEYTDYVRNNYEELNEEEIVEEFNALKNSVGGDIYVLDENGTIRGAGKYKNSEDAHYEAEGDFFEAQFVNKKGIEMYTFGVNINNEYLIYEVSIQSLEGAVDVIMEFLLIMLIFCLVIAALVSYFISINITKPIKQLNELAKKMKDKKVQTLQISQSRDEIGELNQSINLLYEELLSNIQQLETELKKERTVEKMKKQFLAQATHELKTPLAVIQGYAELVSDHIYSNEEERDHYIQSIYDETENMNKLIMDVLEYSKMESGFFSIRKEEVFVNPWINNVVKTFKDIIEKKDIIFTVNNKVGDLCVYMDAFRMEQVVKNLLSNAMEFSDNEIILNAYNLNDGLVIEVINTGEKIDEDALPFVFDSFYKKKGKKSGTGLGLAIVKEIVNMHDGVYRVENLENGVKFSVAI